MKANTRLFGEIDIADDKIILLEDGMIGLPEYRNFALIFDEEKEKDKISVMWLQSMDDQVKIGISAPKEVPVYRKEVYLQIQNENKAALNATDAMEALKNLF